MSFGYAQQSFVYAIYWPELLEIWGSIGPVNLRGGALVGLGDVEEIAHSSRY